MTFKTYQKLSIFIKILLAVVIFLAGIGAGYLYFQPRHPLSPSPAETTQEDLYLSFLNEVYETIQTHYWDKISEEKLTKLFVQVTEKLLGQPQALATHDHPHLETLLKDLLQRIDSAEKKKEFSTKLADLVLANLEPLERSRLYTQKAEKDLKNLVENIDPQTGKKEPTIDYQLVRPEILHLHIKKLSPGTFEELKAATEAVNNQEGLDTLILDLRDNLGGAIDNLPYFLGPFIGQDQYAYQFYHQGEKEDFKTKIGWLPSLVRYKKIVILVNENTQSSAEVMAAVLKKYNVGVVVGTPTRGWGTVEKVFPMANQIDPQEKYSIFLVHHLTLRDDGEPIEGNGVEPLININDPNWEDQLYAYFHYQELIEAVKEVLH